MDQLRQSMTTEYERWLLETELEDMGGGFMGGYEQFDYRHTGPGSPRYFRSEALNKFSFAILTGAMIEQLRRHGPFLEVGSGTGYWAYELRRADVGIIATDPKPYSCVSAIPEKLWTEIERLNALDAIAKYAGPHRAGDAWPNTLLSVWPSLNGEWIADALERFTANGGKKFVYVGEGWGGCTACDRFFDVLDRDWETVEMINMPFWQGIHDYCAVYERKR